MTSAVGGCFLGVDLGSTTAKAVVVDQRGSIRGASVIAMGAVSRAGMQRAVDAALAQAGVVEAELGATISTGYGRRLVPGATRSYTEITCHARGTAAMVPGVRLVIDVGGQDSKAITVDEDGLVVDFAMNDRCASGTGRFYEVLARALEVDLAEVGPLALAGSRDLEVSSMCATFAETEIVSMLAMDLDHADIAASVHRAIASRTLALVAQVGRRLPVVLTGGVAQNPAAVSFLASALDHEVLVPARPQITGAYGAALIARDAAARGSGARRDPGPRADQGDVDSPHQVGAVDHAGAGHSCAGCDGKLEGASKIVDLGPIRSR